MLAFLAVVAVSPDELSAAIEAAVAPLAARVSQLESGMAKLEKENELLKTRSPVRRAVSAAGGDVQEADVARGRRLSDPDGCCRWDAAGSCTGVASDRLYHCTRVHEFLEQRVATHTFTDIDTCMGDSDASTWSCAFSGPAGNVSLSNSGAGTVATFPTPLHVTHAASCGSTLPTLQVQMDTTLQRDVEVKGSLTLDGYVVPPLGPSIDSLTYDDSGNGLTVESTFATCATKTVTLSSASKVLVFYTVVSSTEMYIVTQLHVDSGSGETELMDARAISGDNDDGNPFSYATNNGMSIISLAAGSHTFNAAALGHNSGRRASESLVWVLRASPAPCLWQPQRHKACPNAHRNATVRLRF